ncbi:MAG TPA: histidine kinase [Pseudonocardia sp.]|jgi:signal transduction histidine kinase|nr:histidine kinase [Pseudonocardia sp.]
MVRVPPLVDVAAAAALVAAGAFEIATGNVEGADPRVIFASLLVGGIALLVRSRWPLVCLGLLVCLVILIGPALSASLVAAMLFGFGTVARRCSDRWGSAAAVVAVGALVAHTALGPVPSDVVVFLLAFGGAWIAGRLLRREAVRSAELDERATALAAERDARAREAVSAERTRIARELHDAVAHTVSVMTLLTAGVRRQLDSGPGGQAERDVLLRVERLGREAVEELHRAVGVMRAEAASPAAPLAPQPRLVDIGELAGRVCAAGLPVEVHVTGQARPLPAGVELAAYRVIQEALTNSLKHAGRATATVDIGYDAARLTVAVTDDGVGVPDGWETGHGLVGMRERVAVYGGVVTAGRRPNGGFAVRATLPVAGSQ